MNETSTLWVAVLGVVLGVASLTWHIVSFLLMAGRAKVSAQPNMVMFDPARGTQTPVLQITVRNVGRMPISVTSWTFIDPTGRGVITINPSPEFGPAVPHTIDPGHSEQWRVPRDGVLQALGEGDTSRSITLRPRVWLGTGKQVDGRGFQVPLEE